jgi:hypothetical protein
VGTRIYQNFCSSPPAARSVAALTQKTKVMEGSGIWRQAVAKLESNSTLTEFPQQLVVGILGENLLFINKLTDNPIGVAAYELQSKLPGELKGKLPTAKQLVDVVRTEMEGER